MQDFDGDIFLLCDDPIIINSKIDKNIIIDIEDKTTAKPKPYTKENIIEYEVMTRDNRIGEITNAATSIENKYTTNPDIQKVYDNYASILRVMQGHEIDFIKTGTRWQMNRGLRKYLKQLPYFLLYNYPEKLKSYKDITEKNKYIEEKEDKLRLNAYHSPSPMNELCDYICTWEKKNILWDNNIDDLVDTRCLIVNNDLDLSDKKIMKIVRRIINEYADEMRMHMNLRKRKSGKEESDFDMQVVVNQFKMRLRKELKLNEELIANYVIKVSYSNLSISKSLAWSGYSSYIISNLRENSNPKRNITITETNYKTDTSYEYLGKHYEFKEADVYR